MAEAYFYTSRDLVEVVRCKDCKKRYTIDCPTFHKSDFLEKQAKYLGFNNNENDFCSYGEKKDDN